MRLPRLIERWIAPPDPQPEDEAAIEEASIEAATGVPLVGPRLVSEAIASKLLGSWLANRHQTLIPHTLNVALLPPEQAALLFGFMAAAMQADGEVTAAERASIGPALERMGAAAEAGAAVEAALGQPQPVAQLLGELAAAGLGTYGYAAALLVTKPRSGVNESFFRYAAARLNLPPDVVASLESRYAG